MWSPANDKNKITDGPVMEMIDVFPVHVPLKVFTAEGSKPVAKQAGRFPPPVMRDHHSHRAEFVVQWVDTLTTPSWADAQVSSGMLLLNVFLKGYAITF